jgi:DNA-binding NarL/FixJ family response regulator
VGEHAELVVVTSPDTARADWVLDALLRSGVEDAVVAAPGPAWPSTVRCTDRSTVVLFADYPDARTLASIADATCANHRLAVLVLGPVAPDTDALVALASGASGYLADDIDGPSLAQAVQALRGGEVVLWPTVSRALVRGLRSGGGVVLRGSDGRRVVLTHREWDVLVLLRQGRTTAEIARRFVVSSGTVRTHVAAVLRKLGTESREALLDRPLLAR